MGTDKDKIELDLDAIFTFDDDTDKVRIDNFNDINKQA